MGIVFKREKIKIVYAVILILIAATFVFGKTFVYKIYVKKEEEGYLWFLYNLLFISLFGIINFLISYLINLNWGTKLLLVIGIFNVLLFLLLLGYTVIYPQEKFNKLISFILPYRSFFISPLPILVIILLNFVHRKLFYK
ncbi:MAG: hypothetical protein JST07_01835 [Bacteroidetes bacterium]|nr:hypothetical protein [Bacteroidota bacterium]